MYADDLALVASSPEELQQMLDIVSDYASKRRYQLNSTKSVILVFGESACSRALAGQRDSGFLQASNCRKWMNTTTLGSCN